MKGRILNMPKQMPPTPPLPRWRFRLLRFVFILWLTMLCYGLPEVFAGSGAGWISTPFVYIFAGPLYILHFLVLVQIALLTGRTSWPALYLFGVLFGLYETWITKVSWAGYPGSDGLAMGGLGQGIGAYFGTHETLGLILFYHAVLAFLLPLAVVSRLFPAWGRVFPVPDWVFGRGVWAVLRRLGLLLILGVVTGHNMPDLAIYLVSWLPLIGLLWLGYKILHKAGATGLVAGLGLTGEAQGAAQASNPRLGRKTTVFAITWLAAIYLFGFIAFRPEDTPPPEALLLTALLYPLLIGLIARTKPQKQSGIAPASPPKNAAKLPFRWLLALFGVGLGVVISSAANPGLIAAIAPTAFAMMMPVGVVLFVWLGLWRALFRRR